MQSAELLAKHQKDPYLANISAALRVQTTITAKQAYSLVKEIGRDASSMDYGVVGFSLMQIGELALAEELERKALERSQNATEYLGATRTLAQIMMTERQFAEAEVYWKKALAVYDVYPHDVINEQNVHYTHAWTLLSWAGTSADCQGVMMHVADADKEIGALGVSAPPDVVQWRNSFVVNCPGGPAPSNISSGGSNLSSPSPPVLSTVH